MRPCRPRRYGAIARRHDSPPAQKKSTNWWGFPDEEPTSRRGGRYVRYFGKAVKVAWLKLRERLTMKTQRLSYRGYEIQITHTLVMWRAAIYHSSYLRAVDWTLEPIIAADARIAEIQAQQRIDAVLDGQPPKA
jgi:hypothetical protein